VQERAKATLLDEAIGEAKSLLVFDQSLGQLVAQMVDRLALSRKRKLESDIEATATGEGTDLRRVKGVLTTGQHTLFFELVEAEGGEVPKLHYLGRCQLNILPRLPTRNTEKKINFEHTVSREEVLDVMLHLYSFLRV
jgi:hypothetical protein